MQNSAIYLYIITIALIFNFCNGVISDLKPSATPQQQVAAVRGLIARMLPVNHHHLFSLGILF
jgi:hypothetical protein